jgi:hypothetical protein
MESYTFYTRNWYVEICGFDPHSHHDKYSVVQSQTDNLDNLSGVANVGSNPSDTTKQLKVVQFI